MPKFCKLTLTLTSTAALPEIPLLIGKKCHFASQRAYFLAYGAIVSNYVRVTNPKCYFYLTHPMIYI